MLSNNTDDEQSKSTYTHCQLVEKDERKMGEKVETSCSFHLSNRLRCRGHAHKEVELAKKKEKKMHEKT